jgi:nicotinamide-nucleotide amidase
MIPDDIILTAAKDVIDACKKHGEMTASAESCTGGLISGALTAVDGSSKVVDCGFITYSNEAKMALLDVSPDLLQTHGAVSEPVARAMAEGALRHAPLATITIAVTGVAGPGGGTEEKPVGLVHFGCAGAKRQTLHRKRVFEGDRHQIRRATVLEAFDLVREMIET